MWSEHIAAYLVIASSNWLSVILFIQMNIQSLSQIVAHQIH